MLAVGHRAVTDFLDHALGVEIDDVDLLVENRRAEEGDLLGLAADVVPGVVVEGADAGRVPRILTTCSLVVLPGWISASLSGSGSLPRWSTLIVQAASATPASTAANRARLQRRRVFSRETASCRNGYRGPHGSR